MSRAAVRGHAYRAILAQPSARSLMLWGLVARLREGGIGLALVLLAQQTVGSFAVAGVVGAAFYAAAALLRPVQGRWMDRRGHRETLIVTAVASTVLLVAAVGVAGRGPTWLLVAVSALAGGAMPATSAALRSLWPGLLGEEVRDAAYALDSLFYELAIVIGPALAGLVAATAGAGWAVIAAAGIGLIGTVGVVLVPVGDDREQRRAAAARRTGRLGGRFLTLVTVAFLVGAAEGPLTVALTAAAVRERADAVSGLLVSALAVGSILSLLGYGAHTWKWTAPARLIAATLALTAGLLVLAAAAASTTLVAIAVAAVLVGVALGPTITTIALFVGVAAPRERLAEAFAWTSFATPCGAAAAQAVSGALVAGPGPASGILLGACCAALAVGFALLARHPVARAR